MVLKITTRSIWNSTYTLTFVLNSMKSVKSCFYRAAEYTEPVFESFVSASLYSDSGKCLKRFPVRALSLLRCSSEVFDIASKQRKVYLSKFN